MYIPCSDKVAARVSQLDPKTTTQTHENSILFIRRVSIKTSWINMGTLSIVTNFPLAEHITFLDFRGLESL